MEERKPILKILYENTEKPVNQVWLTFPFSDRERPEQKMLALTKGHEGDNVVNLSRHYPYVLQIYSYVKPIRCSVMSRYPFEVPIRTND